MGIINNSLILLFTRIVLGSLMLYYGFPKVKDLKLNANDFKEMGFSPSFFPSILVAFTEFFGGLGILAGFYTEFFAAAFGFQMIVGTVWKKMKVKKPIGDYSYDILLLNLCVLLMMLGPGVYALVPELQFRLLRWLIVLPALAVGAITAYLAKPSGT